MWDVERGKPCFVRHHRARPGRAMIRKKPQSFHFPTTPTAARVVEGESPSSSVSRCAAPLVHLEGETPSSRVSSCSLAEGALLADHPPP
jgi:hypothetical protein